MHRISSTLGYLKDYIKVTVTYFNLRPSLTLTISSIDRITETIYYTAIGYTKIPTITSEDILN